MRIRCLESREASLEGHREDRLAAQLVQREVLLAELANQVVPT